MPDNRTPSGATPGLPGPDDESEFSFGTDESGAASASGAFDAVPDDLYEALYAQDTPDETGSGLVEPPLFDDTLFDVTAFETDSSDAASNDTAPSDQDAAPSAMPDWMDGFDFGEGDALPPTVRTEDAEALPSWMGATDFGGFGSPDPAFVVPESAVSTPDASFDELFGGFNDEYQAADPLAGLPTAPTSTDSDAFDPARFNFGAFNDDTGSDRFGADAARSGSDVPTSTDSDAFDPARFNFGAFSDDTGSDRFGADAAAMGAGEAALPDWWEQPAAPAESASADTPAWLQESFAEAVENADPAQLEALSVDSSDESGSSSDTIHAPVEITRPPAAPSVRPLTGTLRPQTSTGASTEASPLDSELTGSESASTSASTATPLDGSGFTDAFTSPGDVDEYLRSLRDSDAPDAPLDAGAFGSTDIDFEALLDPVTRPESSPRNAKPFLEDELAASAPDWLSDANMNVSEVSAGAIARQRRDRPVEDLDARLKKLRERSSTLPPPPDAPVIAAGADDAPSPAPLPEREPTARGRRTRRQADVGGENTGGISLTPEQQRRADLLRTLAAQVTATQEMPALRPASAGGSMSATDPLSATDTMSAIDMTYDSPYFAPLESDEGSLLLPSAPDAFTPQQQRTRRRTAAGTRRMAFDRLLITLLLAAAVIAPFYIPALRLGSLPPRAFAVGSPAEAVFRQIEALRPGALVLLAVEYRPASAPELDAATDALLRHLLLRGAYPVLVSGEAVTLLHAENVLNAINADPGFLAQLGTADGIAPNRDYFAVRYLPGGELGVRAFSENSAAWLFDDVNRQAGALNFSVISDFALVVVVADRLEALRAYAEQVAPLTESPLIAAVSYSAAPLIEPYLGAAGGFAPLVSRAPLDGLLVGAGDAYTYHLLLSGSGPEITAAVAPPIAREERPAPRVATLTPTPTLTPTVTPYRTPTPIPPTPTPLPQAVNSGGQSINVRGGPGTDQPVLAQLAPGERASILGYNAARTWANVRLADGTEGWVSAELIRVEGAAGAWLPGGKTDAAKSSAPDLEQDDEPGEQPVPTRFVQVTPRTRAPLTETSVPTETRTLTATPTPTATRTRTATDAPTETRTLRPTAADTATDEPTAARTPRPTATDEPVTATEAERTAESAVTRIFATRTPATRTPRQTVAVTPEVTDARAGIVPETTMDNTPDAEPEVTAVVVPPDDRPVGTPELRWYAFNLGIVVSVAVIGFGTLANLIRALTRRRR